MICSPSGFGRFAYSSAPVVVEADLGGGCCWPFSAQNCQRYLNSGTRTDLKMELSIAVPRAGEAVAEASELLAAGRSEVDREGRRLAIVGRVGTSIVVLSEMPRARSQRSRQSVLGGETGGDERDLPSAMD